ncbi:MAG: hypothetical protein IPN17_20400 [Deltaproteobacteria bacterium]|nr:hypothetical protein [Deltaproteobacteria bacterium]
MATPPDDPIARAWTVALRSQLDAVVAQFEAQLRQHVAYSNASHGRELAGLNARITELDQSLVASRAVQSQQAAELARLLGERERWTLEARQLQDALRAQTAELTRLRDELAERDDEARTLAMQVQSLDAQFASERDFVAALLGVSGSQLFDAAQATLGAALDATPGCYGALKAKRMDVVLAGAMRERGRSAVRSTLGDDERRALSRAAAAAGCELVEAALGQRYSAASMDKAGERAEPAEEGLVVACVMPGLRLAGSAGSLVHPRVIVGTA